MTETGSHCSHLHPHNFLLPHYIMKAVLYCHVPPFWSAYNIFFQDLGSLRHYVLSQDIPEAGKVVK